MKTSGKVLFLIKKCFFYYATTNTLIPHIEYCVLPFGYGALFIFKPYFYAVVFNINGAVGYALFISLISGYPIGAKTVADLKNSNALNDTEAVRASAVCSTSSPMFLIGSVGSIMFNDKRFGLSLFLCHVFSVLINGFFFSFYKRKEKNTAKPF